MEKIEMIHDEVEEIDKSLALLDAIAESDNRSLSDLDVHEHAMKMVAKDIRERTDRIFQTANKIRHDENELAAAREELREIRYHNKVLEARIASAVDSLNSAIGAIFPGSIARTEQEKKETEDLTISAAVWVGTAKRTLLGQEDRLVPMLRREQ